MDVSLADPYVGRVLDGRYTVRSRIARGGMASVYLAVDERLDREVAVKVMHEQLVHDQDFVRRFTREARSAARLNHHGIVQVFDQGFHDGVAFLAMEFVPGRTLRDVMRERGAMPAGEAFDLLEPVLEALAAAHRAGIVHRDVKPENVLIADDGRVKVADFGLARAVDAGTSHSQTGVLLGTVSYLAPEQVERGVADARSDVYAAGVVLFELLTASKPFAGDTPVQVALQHVSSRVPAPSSRAAGVDPALDDLVLLAAAREPDARPADARDLLMALRETRRRLGAAALTQRPVPLGTLPAAAPSSSGADVLTDNVPFPDGAGQEGYGPPDRTIALGAVGAVGAVGALGELGQPGAIGPLGPGIGAAQPTGRGARRRRPGRRGTVALVVVVLLAAVLGAGGWYLGAGPGAYVRVPIVSGLTQSEAEQALARRNLGGRVSAGFSESVPRGSVISADPTDGARIRRGGTVELVVSKGPERYAVPRLAGLSEDDARAALTRARLVVGTVRRQFSDTVPDGSVIQGSLEPGLSVRPGTKVDLVISRGREPVALADWTGKPAAEATAALRDSGLKVTTSQAFDDTVPRGSVVSQQPGQGTVFKNDTVRLVVSKGPRLVAVPRVVGKTQDEARAVLEKAGFTVKVTSVFGGSGRVIAQSPAAGREVRRGSTVTIAVL